MGLNKKKLTDAIAEICKVGVGRNRKNEQQGYMYRGADDVLDTVTPILSRHGIYMRPVFEFLSEKEVATRNGTATEMRVKLTLSLCDSECSDGDGVLMETTTYGEARDSGDKCVMKAQTVALKYALIYALGIPVIGTENDPDSTGEPEPTYNPRVSKAPKQKPVEQPAPVSISNMMMQTEVKEEPKQEKPVEQPAPVKQAEPVKEPEPVKAEPVKEQEPEKQLGEEQIEKLKELGIFL